MSSKTKNWTVEDFRRELAIIDEHVRKTQGINLCGASLDIGFSNARCTLGMYYYNEMKFRFSIPFFNSDIPEACAIDVIRHEYAHYYAHAVMGYSGGHGKPFKAACKIVGALPSRLYSHQFEAVEREREIERARTYSSRLKVGEKIIHPGYGAGAVTSIENGRTSALLTVSFKNGEIKKIDECWLIANGKIL